MTQDRRSKRYRGFISYSQTDKPIARRLHKALENYRAPRGVSASGLDPKSRKLGRFFRDDDEMGAAPDLGEALRGAIADADNLIVICSPKAAQSKWVNEEILHFKRTGRQGKIFAVIVSGQPNSGRPETECYAPALRYRINEAGELTDEPAEPLGLYWHKESKGRLKARLAAGLLGVDFDDFWRRDRRRARRRAGVIGASIAAAVAVLGSVTALVAEGFRQQSIQLMQQDAARRAELALASDQLDEAVRLTVDSLQIGPHRFSRELLEEVLAEWPVGHIPFSVMPTFDESDPAFGFAGFNRWFNGFAVFSDDDRFALIKSPVGTVFFDRTLMRRTNVAPGLERTGDIIDTGAGFLAAFVNRPIDQSATGFSLFDPAPIPHTGQAYDLAVFDMPSGRELASTGGVVAHALSHSAQSVFVAHEDGRQCLYAITNGSELTCLSEPVSNPYLAVFSGDDSLLAVATVDGAVELVSGDLTSRIQGFRPQGALVAEMAFALENTRLIIHTSQDRARMRRSDGCSISNTSLFDLESNRRLQTLNSLCHAPRVSEDGGTLMSPVGFFDLVSGQLTKFPDIERVRGEEVRHVGYASSLNGELIAASTETEIIVANRVTGEEVISFDGFASTPRALHFLDGDTKVFGVDRYGFGLVWEIGAEQPPPRPLLRFHPEARALDVIPGSDRVVGQSGGLLSIWWPSDGATDRIFDTSATGFGWSPNATGARYTGMALSPDGKVIAIGDPSGDVFLFSTELSDADNSVEGGADPTLFRYRSDAIARFAIDQGQARRLAFSGDGQTLIAFSYEQPVTVSFSTVQELGLEVSEPTTPPIQIKVWDLNSFEMRADFAYVPASTRLPVFAISADGQTIVLVAENDQIEIRDSHGGDLIRTIDLTIGDIRRVTDLKLNRDGSQLLYWYNDFDAGLSWSLYDLNAQTTVLSAADAGRILADDAVETLYILDLTGTEISALDLETGQTQWATPLELDAVDRDNSRVLSSLRLEDDGSLNVRQGTTVHKMDVSNGTVLLKRRMAQPFATERVSPNYFIYDRTSGVKVWSREAVSFYADTSDDLLIAAVCDLDQGELLAGRRIRRDTDWRSGRDVRTGHFGHAFDVCRKVQQPSVFMRIARSGDDMLTEVSLIIEGVLDEVMP